MQARRRSEGPKSSIPCRPEVRVPAQYWEALEQRDMAALCNNALAGSHSPAGIVLPFLGEDLLVNRKDRGLYRQNHDRWDRVEHPLLETLCLVYLLNVGPQPLSHDMVSVSDLRDAHFFKGPHELKVTPLLERYGNDLDGFKRAAERLAGEGVELADVAYRIRAFPKVPIYYLLWQGEEEFAPRLSILFDRSIEHHLSADAIWGLTNLVSDILLMGDQWFLT